METSKMALCRLCAEVKQSSQLWNLEHDENKYSEIIAKLNLLNANDILDFTIHKRLPKVICLQCDESLNHVQEFLAKIQRAQDVLAVLSAKSFEDQKDEWKSGFDLPPRVERVKSEGSLQVEIKSEPLEMGHLNPTNKLQYDVTEIQKRLNLNTESEFSAFTTETSVEPKNMDNQPTMTTENYNFSSMDMKKCNTNILESMLTAQKPHELTDIQKHLNSRDVQKCLKNLESQLETFSSRAYESTKERIEKAFNFPLLRDLIQMPLNSEKGNKTKGQKVKGKKAKKVVRKGTKNSYSWQCSTCEVKFNTLDELQTHRQNDHGVEPPRKRRKRNSPVTEEELTCKLCNTKYKNLQCVWAHNFRAHGKDSGGLYQFTCDKCGKTYNKKGSLKSHLIRHDREKIHVCQICDQGFIFPNQLRHHLKHHSGVKPFACTQCDKRFASNKHLLRHGFVHTDLRPFACTECSSTFRTKNAKNNHMSIHTGARAYTCEYCGMAFSCWGNCNKHMKRIHNATMAKRKRTANGVIPLDPATGELKELNVEALEEWKKQMLLEPPPPPAILE